MMPSGFSFFCFEGLREVTEGKYPCKGLGMETSRFEGDSEESN